MPDPTVYRPDRRAGAVAALVLGLAVLACPAAAQDGIAAEIATSDRDGTGRVVPDAAPADRGPDRIAPSDRAASANRAGAVVTVAPAADRAVPRNAPPSATEAAAPDGPVDLAADEVGLAALLGLPVRGTDGAEIGAVTDVAISLTDGRVVALVVGDAGGIFGLGADDEARRVPLSDVAIDPLGGAVIVGGGADGT